MVDTMARTAASTEASGACSADVKKRADVVVIKKRASTKYVKGIRSEKHKAFVAVLVKAEERIGELLREVGELKRENVLLKGLLRPQ